MNREAQILTALQGNITSEAKRALVDELNTIRAKASRRVAVAREVELGKEAASAHLTPAQPYVRHTTETDWLGKVASTRHTAAEIHQMAKSAASSWFRQTAPIARANPTELNIQAVGQATLWAGQFGDLAHMASSSFLQSASHLAGVKFAADENDDPEEDQDDPEESYEEADDDDDTDDGGNPFADDSKKEGSLRTAARAQTKFTLCPAHKNWFSGDTRYRMAETFGEGGPGSGPSCSGDGCKIAPGTDLFWEGICDQEYSTRDMSPGNPFQWSVNSTKSASRKTAISMDDVQRWCDRNGCVMKDFPDELIESVAESGDLEQLSSYLDDMEAAEIGERNDDFRHTPDHDGYYGSLRTAGEYYDDLGPGFTQNSFPQSEKREVARWSTKGGKMTLVLTHGQYGYDYDVFDRQWSSPRSSGSVNGSSDQEAIAEIEARMARGWHDKGLSRVSTLRTAGEGMTCSVCGDAMTSTDGSYHHDNGTKHDHEAKPGKESSRRTAGRTSVEYYNGHGGASYWTFYTPGNNQYGSYDSEAEATAAAAIWEEENPTLENFLTAPGPYTLGSPRSSSLRTAGERCGATTQARIGNQTEMTVTCSKPAGHTGDHQGVTLDSDDNAIMYRFSVKTAASPDFKSYPKNRAQGQEWSTTCSVCGGTETGTDYYNGWPSQNAFHNHLLCGHDPDADYHQDLAIDRYSSRRTAEADGIDSPSPDSQNGYAESTLDDVSVTSAPEDTNMGWIAEGDSNAVTGSMGHFEAMFMGKQAGLYPDENAKGVTTWADGYGNWHATADSPEEARKAIERELADRGDIDPQNYEVEVKLVDGRHYVEAPPQRPEVVSSRKAAAREGWWPLVPDDRYPGENKLVCPTCGSPDVSISGNNLGRDIITNNLYTSLTCNSCGRRDILPEKPKDLRGASRKQAVGTSRTASSRSWPTTSYYAIADDGPDNEMHEFAPGSADRTACGKHTGWCRAFPPSDAIYCPSCFGHEASRKHAEANGIDSPSPQSQNGYAETTLTDVSVGSAPDDTNLGWITDGDPNAQDEGSFEAPDNPIANEASLNAHFAALVTAGENDRPAGAAPMVDQVTNDPEDDTDMFGGEWVHEGLRHQAVLDWDFVDGLSPDEQAALVRTMGFSHPADLNDDDWTALFSSPGAASWASDYSSRYSSLRQAMHPDDDPSQGPGYLNDAPNLLGDPPGMDPEDYEDTDMFAPEASRRTAGWDAWYSLQEGDPIRIGFEESASNGTFVRIEQNSNSGLYGDRPAVVYLDDAGRERRYLPTGSAETGNFESPRPARTAGLKTAMPAPADLGVSVGSIFYSSWGYDQTNVSFYEVVGLTPASVKVREVAKSFVSQNGPGGNKVIPQPGNYIGGEMTKRLQNSGYRDAAITINSSETAWLWDGKPQYETDSMYGH